MSTALHSLAATVSVKGTSMSTWVFVVCLIGAFLLGVVITAGLTSGIGKASDGKPWWYDVAFPKPDESTLGGLKVLADRYALGEIDADEYQLRAKALRDSAPEPYPTKGKKK